MGLHDKPRYQGNGYSDLLSLGKPNKKWTDKQGRQNFVFDINGAKNHYILQGEGDKVKLNLASSTNTKTGVKVSYDKPGDFSTRRVTQADGSSSQTIEGASPATRYQVSAERQARSPQTAGKTGGQGKFHGNQYTTHGTDVPVKGPQPKQKAVGNYQMPRMAAEMKIRSSHLEGETNKAFWVRSGSAPLVGGGTISVRWIDGPGTWGDEKYAPVWTIKKPDGEKTVIRGMGIKDGKPSGDTFTATITKPTGEKQTLRQEKGKISLASGSSGKKHPFHGNQYTAHGKEVPTKTKKSVSGLDFTTYNLLGY